MTSDSTGAPAPEASTDASPSTNFWILVMGALGVVYGDIGTSPLYAMKACFYGPLAVTLSPENVLGILSLFFWSIVFVVGVKYCLFILRADNHGEGGLLSLLALLSTTEAGKRKGAPGWVLTLILFGSALLFGDGMLTPAISVLSAVEGLNVATPATEHWVVPITLGILVALFSVQKKGTGSVGKVFGPIMVVWFVVLGVTGVVHIWEVPGVLAAINPLHAVRFLLRAEPNSFLVLGAVALCVTGAEALYADMGHFGRSALRMGWYAYVMPCLLLNYFGQGALILQHPDAVSSPFYSMVPRWGLYPMVALATAAAVIASQAMISGGFSLARQAVQLGYLPRLTVVHTSRQQEGQIYIPEINWTLMFGCAGLVLGFRSSDNLAVAYGLTVMATMLITSVVYYVLATKTWHWSWWKTALLVLAFLMFDASFLAANLGKFLHGGFVPCLIAAAAFTLATTWKRGRMLLARKISTDAVPLEAFLKEIQERNVPRVRGTAVFMSANSNATPPALTHHCRHNQMLHERVVLLTVTSEPVPAVHAKDRLAVTQLSEGFYRVVARYGFMQTPNVPIVLQGCSLYGLVIDMETVTYYLGRETLIPRKVEGMPDTGARFCLRSCLEMLDPRLRISAFHRHVWLSSGCKSSYEHRSAKGANFKMTYDFFPRRIHCPFYCPFPPEKGHFRAVGAFTRVLTKHALTV